VYKRQLFFFADWLQTRLPDCGRGFVISVRIEV